MSFCRITGKARNLPKSNYFPMSKTFNASELRRYCRVTGKSYGLPTHHFQPVELKKKVKKTKNGQFTLGGNRDPNYGQRKHKVVSSQKYVIPDLDSADDLKVLLDEILEGIDIEPEELEKRYVYKIGEHKCHIIISARMEAAVRSGAIQDIMFAKDGETIVIKTKTGQLIPLDLKQIKGRAIGELFEGEGVQEEETPEIELGRVTEHLRRFSLFEKIAKSVIDTFPAMQSTGNGKKLQKQLEQIIKEEKYSNMLVNFIDTCVDKIVKGAEKHGNPIKGIGKKTHRDEKILKILTKIFDTPNQEIIELQQLAIAQEEGENILDRINGTVARYTPGTLDYIIANISTCDPNETVMNILQLGIQTFLKEVSSANIGKIGKNGYVNGMNGLNGINGTNGTIPHGLEYYQEFLEHTMGLVNCLTRTCGEIECYGADVQTILTDFIHANAARCNFETPKVELIMEIPIQTRILLFHTHDEQELEHYLSKHKKKCRNTVLVIRDGIKAIIPRAMLKFFGDTSTAIVMLDDEGIKFVLSAIKDEDHYLLDGSQDGIIDPKSYVSKRPRRKSSIDKSFVKNERHSSGTKVQKKRRRTNPAANPHWKNVYKKYTMINDAIYMFRAYTHENKANRFTRY